jgi:hypothetical protein
MEELIMNVILNSESDTGFIGDAVEIGNVVLDMFEDGVDFGIDLDELDEMIDENDILQITKIVCEDCGLVEYIVEEVFDEEGYTIPDELETLYIDSDLIDCVDLEAFGDTEIIVVELKLEDDNEEECDRDCANCKYSDDEDYEVEDIEEDFGEALADELLSSIIEIDPNDAEAVYYAIVDKINETFEIGYKEGVDDSLLELQDAVDAIDSLRSHLE